MLILESFNDLLSEVAKSADLCLKPWKHSVLSGENNVNDEMIDNELNELILRVECRNLEGERFSENDLELEIFRSGPELNITLAWINFPIRPILWQGKHSLWMDSQTGKRIPPPPYGQELEAFARRLRSTFLEFSQD
tara:strand:+ start:118 stop:528 length:411 start_codon:yes stop_codon:yes gene_type:complete